MTDKVAIPTTPEAFAASLADKEQLLKIRAEFGPGTEGLTKYTQAYEAAKHKADPELAAQMREQAQIAVVEMMARATEDDENGGKKAGKKARVVAAGTFQTHNPEAIGAALDGIAPSLGHYVRAIWKHQNPNTTPDAAEAKIVQQVLAYQEKVPDQGGFLVPEEYRSQILQLSLGQAIVRPRAQVFPMSTATLSVPVVDETTRVGSVLGGVVVYRTEEGAELTASDAKFGRIKFEASKQTALAELTNELLKDVPALSSWIDQNIPAALAYAEDADYIGGNGAGMPLGALHANNTALIVVAKETSQTASTIVLQNVLGMIARFGGNYNRAVWLASPDALKEIYTMGLTVGTGGSAVMISPGGGTDAPALTLFGRPLIFSEMAPAALGTQGDLSLVDYGWYGIGDRQAVTVDMSAHVKFTSDKTVVRAIARNDGRPLVLSPLTPRNNSATLSPFVTLATRA